jgi:HAD superfamily hydrolase (TIGR01509 family)
VGESTLCADSGKLLQMIELYIFDMGGVVSLNTDVSGRIVSHLGMAADQWRDLFHEGFIGLMAGSITAEQFWRRVFVVTGHRVDEDLWAHCFHPVPNHEVISTIRELRAEARVVAGTNTIESHYQVHERNGDYDIFDGVYASQRIGLVKPDPAFYNYILEKEGCAPERTVFVDDAEVNVTAAARLGIRSLLYTEAGKLKRELNTLRGKHSSAP